MSINHFLLLLTTRSIKRTLSKSHDNDSCYINYMLSLYYHSHGQVHKLYLEHIQMKWIIHVFYCKSHTYQNLRQIIFLLEIYSFIEYDGYSRIFTIVCISHRQMDRIYTKQ